VFKLVFRVFASFMLITTLAILAVFLTSRREPLPQTDDSTALIGFFTNTPLSSVLGDLVILNPITREERIFSLAPGTGAPDRLFWSPDYSKVTLSYQAGLEVYYSPTTLDVSTGSLEKLTSDLSAQTRAGGYSATGTKIFYIQGPFQSQSVASLLYAIEVSYEEPQQLISVDNIEVLDAFWSPVDSVIAATAYDLINRLFPGSFPNTDIFLTDVNQNIVVNVTETASSEYFSDWSPDGSSVAYVSDETGKREVYVVDNVGRNKRQITHTDDPFRIHDALWARDSRSLIYLTQVSDGSLNSLPVQLIRHDLVTGTEQVLVEKDAISSFDLSPTTDELAYISSNNRDPSRLCVLNFITFAEWCAEHEALSDSTIAWGID
jgi:hypothetical protein